MDEMSLKNSIKSHTSIKLKPNITIMLKSIVSLKEVTDISIEGPATLVDFGIYIQNSSNIILHNIRILNASIYGVLVYGSHNVVINQMTIVDASRGSVDQGKCIDITEGASNITVSFTMLGYSSFSNVDKYKGMLIANFLHDVVTNVSIHHNIFYQNYQRSPEISTNGLFDFKNNFVYGFTVYGSRMREKAYGNYENNYYIGGKKDAMVFVEECSQLSYVRNNQWKYNYIEWQPIQDLGQHRYAVPYVTKYDLPTLLKNMGRIGCT